MTSPDTVMVGKKISEEMDNPIDHWLSILSNKLSPSFRKVGFTPNYLTTLSFLLEIIGVGLLFTRFYLLAGIVFFAGYFFDVMDGYYARYYNMCTEFGDFYDHITDISASVILVLCVINLNIPRKRKILFAVVWAFFLATSTISIGCIQKMYQINPTVSDINRDETFLDILGCLCDGEKQQAKIRLLGCGTYYLALALMMTFVRVGY